MQIYDAFINRLGARANVDLHIYHCDALLFLNILKKNKNAYDFYVVMTHFKTEKLSHTGTTDEVNEALKQIPKNRLVILDNDLVQLKGHRGGYQEKRMTYTKH